jgi:hypothetical protein
MVTSLINDTRCLSLELSFSALRLNVRTNVELYTHFGESLSENGVEDRLLNAAISETLQVHADFFRAKVTKSLPTSRTARAKAFGKLNEVVSNVGYSLRWQEHNWDQLDLFEQAGSIATANLVTAGSLLSPSEDPELVILNALTDEDREELENSAQD